MVAAQLVERSLPTQEIRDWNPDIRKLLSTNCKIEKTKIKKKRLGMANLLKNTLTVLKKFYQIPESQTRLILGKYFVVKLEAHKL